MKKRTVFYSEELKREFDSAEDCIKAEKEYAEKKAAQDKIAAEKSARAKEVEDAYKAIYDKEMALYDARNKFVALKNKFVKDYGQFHFTFRENVPLVELSVKDLIDFLFN